MNYAANVTTKNMSLSVRDLSLIGVFAAIIAILSQIGIPMPYGVPMTLQTFAIPFAGLVLGAKRGTLATVVYILLGAVGAPVFSGFSGGIGIVLGMTGGFILSFPLLSFWAGFGGSKNNVFWLVLCLVCGAVMNYLCGVLWFSFVMSSSLETAFAACVLPFIPTDCIKIVLVTLSGRLVKDALTKARVL